MADGIALSVVVPFDGNAPLELWLDYVAAQKIDWNSVEIIIANSCPERTAAIASTFSFLPIRLVDVAGGVAGHSAATLRNRGASVASGSRIAFLDSDCLLAAETLQLHAEGRDILCGIVRELAANDAHLIAPSSDCAAFGTIWDASSEDYRISHRHLAHHSEAEWSDCYSSNMSLPMRSFRHVGGFDETGFRCHDMDLAYRLAQQGSVFRFSLSAKSIHLEHRRSLIYRVQQQAGWMLLAKKFPELTPLARDNGESGKVRVRQIFGDARRQFTELVAGLPGTFAGTCYVVAPGTSRESVLSHLGDQPLLKVDRASGVEYVLRMNRDCWDFSILIPDDVLAQAPRWTVVITAYQGAAMIERAIDSVLRQTDQSFELIVVDDASTDSTFEKVRAYAGDGRVRYVCHQENRGQSVALNTGLYLANGEWLLQLDVDDWLERDCLKTLATHLAKPEIVACYGKPRIWQDGRVDLDDGHQVATSEDHFTYPNVQAPRAYSVAAARALGGWATDDAFRGRYYEDRPMLARMHQAGKVSFEPSALYNVTMRRGSLGRGEPARIAAAKLVVLTHEAARRGKQLQYRFDGQLLRAALTALEDGPARWSVIIPHRDQWNYLRLSLWSWRQSDLPADAEIIVVDDHSATDPPAELHEIDPRIRFVSVASGEGAAAARNAGAAMATGDLMIFSDADHLVPPTICQAHLRILRDDPGALSCGGVFGRRTATIVDSSISAFRRVEIADVLARRQELRPAAAALIGSEEYHLLPVGDEIWRRAQCFAYDELWMRDWARLILEYGNDMSGLANRWLRVGGGNLAVSRALFDRVGGFDEALLSKEDWDFGLRAQEAGARIVANLEAEVLHQVHPVRRDRAREDEGGAEDFRRKHPAAIESLRRSSPSNRPPGSASLFAKPAPVDPVPQKQGPPVIALTFDDGPHRTGTPLVLDTLAQVGAKATFFLLGENVRRERDLCLRQRREGHELGVHGWVHTHPSAMSRDDARHQVIDGFNAVADATGQAPRFFRPPYGLLTPVMAEACAELGLVLAGWDHSFQDWAGAPMADMIKAIVGRDLRTKVLLFHDGSGNFQETCALLDWLLRAVNNDLSPVTLSEFARNRMLPALEMYQAPSLDDWHGKTIEDLVVMGEL